MPPRMNTPRDASSKNEESSSSTGNIVAGKKRQTRHFSDNQDYDTYNVGPPSKRSSRATGVHTPTPTRIAPAFLDPTMSRSHTPGLRSTQSRYFANEAQRSGTDNKITSKQGISYGQPDPVQFQEPPRYPPAGSEPAPRTPGPPSHAMTTGQEPLFAPQPWTNPQPTQIMQHNSAAIDFHSLLPPAKSDRRSRPASRGRSRAPSRAPSPNDLIDGRLSAPRLAGPTTQSSEEGNADRSVEMFEDFVNGIGGPMPQAAAPAGQSKASTATSLLLTAQTFGAFARNWTALGSLSLRDIWSAAQDQCGYTEVFPPTDLKDVINSHRTSMDNSLDDLRKATEDASTERQQMIVKAETVLKKMRAKTEKYDEARQKVISSVAQRPPTQRKFCTLL